MSGNSKSSEKLMLNLGCGTKKIANHVNVDIDSACSPDIVCDARKLPYKDNTVDEIFASDILEHFSWRETRGILEHWYSILKKDGQLIIKTPNLDTILAAYQEGRIPFQEFVRKIYANQDTTWNFHYAGFRPEFLRDMLMSIGFTIQRCQPTLDGGDWSNMAIRCRK